MHNPKRAAPSYHWEGFGRKNTKPPWFNCRVFDKDRRDVGWVVKDFGAFPSQVGEGIRHTTNIQVAEPRVV